MIFPQVTRKHFITPAIVRVQSNFTTATSFTVTPSVAPVFGNVIFMFFGAANTSTISSIPSGWHTSIGSSSVTANYVFYKFVTESEPGSYTFTFTGSTNGGYQFAEFSGLAYNSSEISIFGTSGAVGPTTSYNPGAITIPYPGLALSCMSKTGTSSWTPSGGWNLLSGAGQQKMAYQIFSNITTSGAITWTGTSETVCHHLFLLRAKTVRT